MNLSLVANTFASVSKNINTVLSNDVTLSLTKGIWRGRYIAASAIVASLLVGLASYCLKATSSKPDNNEESLKGGTNLQDRDVKTVNTSNVNLDEEQELKLMSSKLHNKQPDQESICTDKVDTDKKLVDIEEVIRTEELIKLGKFTEIEELIKLGKFTEIEELIKLGEFTEIEDTIITEIIETTEIIKVRELIEIEDIIETIKTIETIEIGFDPKPNTD